VKQQLLLHGFLGAPASWNAVRCCLTATPDIQCFTPALLGHGPQASAAAVAEASDQSFVEELARLSAWARHEGFRRGVIAGYSLGARLALGLALRFPELCSHLVLISGTAGLTEDSERATRREADDALAQRLESFDVPAFVEFWEQLPLFESQRALGAATLAEQRGIRLGHTALPLAHALRCLSLGRMPNFWPELSSLGCSVTLLVGERDAKFRRLNAEIHACCPKARLVSVPDAGHNLLLEAPERVAEILAQ
jgi:2-succinyl-6-hydroxy-2,4-cyclohexadiene-1-carboxylate synthase